MNPEVVSTEEVKVNSGQVKHARLAPLDQVQSEESEEGMLDRTMN